MMTDSATICLVKRFNNDIKYLCLIRKNPNTICRCSGLHARYNDGTNEFFPWPKGLGNLMKFHLVWDRSL